MPLEGAIFKQFQHPVVMTTHRHFGRTRLALRLAGVNTT